ncbi:unnamed protein product [Parnassius mnemosyne]|uniref:THAP-type domain-containing protein n=1 Tax=Parnassius mnemosyne TaxID=213953 RepID=A0AAV1L0S2_9NEOP
MRNDETPKRSSRCFSSECRVKTLKMPRTYCIVYGCLNSASSKPELSYFKLPADFERRSQWLRLIAREDLMSKPPQNYTVCEEHFNAMDILTGTHRKKLKTNSLPSLQLPVLQKKDVETLTEAPKLVDICTQTEENIILSASDSSQTSRSLSLNTPRKRKLKSDLLECRKKKLYEIYNKTGKYQRDKFYELCDKFLTKELAMLVKAQTHSKFNYTGNRYDQNYKM